MPFSVKFFNTTSTPTQEQIVPDATPHNDGVMTKEQAAKLAGLTPGSGFVNQGSEAFSIDGLSYALIDLLTPHASTDYEVFVSAGRVGVWTGPGESIIPNYHIVSASQFYIYVAAPFDGKVSWGTTGATP